MTEPISIDPSPGLADSLALWLIPWLRPAPTEIDAGRQHQLREPEAGP